MIVYLARNRLNGKGYVGKTTRNFEQRIKEHLQAARSGADQLFGRALRKHGPDAFEWSVLETVHGDDEAALDEAERRLIAEHWTYVHDHPDKGYNLTRGGDGVKGLKHTEDAKRRMGLNRSGERNHNYDKKWGRTGPHTEETKSKMSEAKKGTHHTEEARVKISEALRQRVRKTRSVIQYDMSGNVVATYPSMKDAAIATGGHKDRVGDCCRGTRESHVGYHWRYAEEQKGSR